MKYLFNLIFCFFSLQLAAQGVMSPELLWSVGRVNGAFLHNGGKSVAYSVTSYDVEQGTGKTYLYTMDTDGNNSRLINDNAESSNFVTLHPDGSVLYSQKGVLKVYNGDVSSDLNDKDGLKFAPKSGRIAFYKRVKTERTASDIYPEYTKSTARIYDDLMYRHWSNWEDGSHNHVFIGEPQPNGSYQLKDIMAGESFDAPTMPFGGSGDYTWNNDGTILAYVSVKKKGLEYATTTNSDIYFYEVASGNTTNFTKGMMGYDNNPAFSPNGRFFSWTSMPRDGYESDKNSIWIADLKSGDRTNLFSSWDGTVSDYQWAPDIDKIYFVAPVHGAQRLHEILLEFNKDGSYKKSTIRQITNEDVDYNHIVGITATGQIIAHRTDMNHAVELYSVNPVNGTGTQLTRVNNAIYESIKLSPIEKKMIGTSDGKEMLAWVIYPPGFDPAKKYPALVYCQGGPQSALTQFYSYRWNFQLMAANGYIVIAPNRRGMPGYGQAWNEAISGDWGGQPIADYLSAADYLADLPYVDRERIGAVGASYGGYSVYMLAGIHNKRFKTFISHCGLFNMESWYGSTEELFFANFDLKGPYWQKPTPKSYLDFNPIRFVDKWDTPMLIIEGEKDYRVPYTQGLEAYQAARLKGIKARLLMYPDEGHWVSKPHNSLVWHHEFFRWLRETL